jgi:hypothetical protein
MKRYLPIFIVLFFHGHHVAAQEQDNIMQKSSLLSITLGTDQGLDRESCNPFLENAVIFLKLKKSIKPLNVLYGSVKVDQECRILDKTPNPQFFWIMGHYSLNNLVPCIPLDAKEKNYFLPFNPNSEGAQQKNPSIDNQYFLKYGIGLLPYVQSRYEARFNETLGPYFQIQTFKKDGKCEVKNWISITNDKKEKVLVNIQYVFAKVNVIKALLRRFALTSFTIKGTTKTGEAFIRQGTNKAGWD